MTSSEYNPALHRLALLTAAATFPLIFMGGLVTSHGAGMSVPDWPNSYGYNMFLFPPRLWIGGILYEHTHRLMGTIVGMLSIALAIAAWKTEPRAWVRNLAYAVLGAVIFQGVLGGLRVVLVKLDLAIVHACFAQAFFCLTALMCVVTSKWWHDARNTGFQPLRDRSHGLETCDTGKVIALAAACVFAVYLQLVVGAMMRHYGAGLAIPDLPLAYGKFVPPTGAAGLDAINQTRAWQYHLPPVTLQQMWLHFAHRAGACVVSILILALVTTVFVRYRARRALLIPAILLIIFLFAQITLGVITVLWMKPADIASAHVAVGALVLMTSFVMTIRAARLYRPVLRESVVHEHEEILLPQGHPVPA